MTTLSYLNNLTRKQGLNALLDIYEVYKDAIYHYLNEPMSPSNKDLNILYMRELVPAIQKLVRDLHLDSGAKVKGPKLPKNYILSTNLFGLEKTLLDLGKDSKYASIESAHTYGLIKELVEKELAVSQPRISEIGVLIDKTKSLINTSLFAREKKNSPSQSLQIGPLKYIDQSLFYKEEKLKLTPQEMKLCKLFMDEADKYISDNTIKEIVFKTNQVSTINMQKLVSKLRRTLMGKKLKDCIKRITNEGYTFETKDIH